MSSNDMGVIKGGFSGISITGNGLSNSVSHVETKAHVLNGRDVSAEDSSPTLKIINSTIHHKAIGVFEGLKDMFNKIINRSYDSQSTQLRARFNEINKIEENPEINHMANKILLLKNLKTESIKLNNPFLKIDIETLTEKLALEMIKKEVGDIGKLLEDSPTIENLLKAENDLNNLLNKSYLEKKLQIKRRDNGKINRN